MSTGAMIATVALLAIALVIALWPHSDNHDVATPEPTPLVTQGSVTVTDPSTATPSPLVPAQAETAKCHLSDTSTQVPASTPGDLSWKLWHGVAVPTSASAGPAVVDETTGATSCYAHTPLGALLAATNIAYRLAGAAPSTVMASEQLAPGPGRDLLLAQVAAFAKPGTLAQLAGFRFVSFTPDSAVIQLVNGQQINNSLRSSVLTVVWNDGTWQLQATADGQVGTSPQPVLDMSGFTELEGIS